MSNELKTLTIDGIECYEKDGVAYLRLETVARGAWVYKIGSETLGLHIPAGMRGTFTRIYFDNDKIYRFGIGNLSAALDGLPALVFPSCRFVVVPKPLCVHIVVSFLAIGFHFFERRRYEALRFFLRLWLLLCWIV